MLWIHKERIQTFKDDWTQLHLEFGVPITNKCHIIFDHLVLEHFIDVQGKPLGEFSEQGVEDAHQKIWAFYIVKMVENEKHGHLKNVLTISIH